MNNNQEVNTDNIKSIMEDIISNFCSEYSIDQSDIPPQKWNAIIQVMHERIFKNNRYILRNTKTQYNEYNLDKVNYVYDIYKYLSNTYGQEITLKKFCDLTGIEKQTMYDWNNGRLSSQRSDLIEKIHSDNEESLESMLHDKRYNPMKILPSLNRKHQWNLPGVSKERVNDNALTDSKAAFEQFKLSQSSRNVKQIEQND